MKRVALIILDGWGDREEEKGNAIKLAITRLFPELEKNYRAGQLMACGEWVGLMPGQMGNSEVGHLNLGGGRVVLQLCLKIFREIERGEFAHKVQFREIDEILNSGGSLHLIGLVSDGGVHSHIDHIFALLDRFATHSDRIFLHAITDGRDTDPKSGLGFLKKVTERVKLASVVGRYYAMDRDKRWDRTKKAYECFVERRGDTVVESNSEALSAVESYYSREITDEFLLPIVVESAPPPGDGDAVLFFNFRADRMRQIVGAFSQSDFSGFPRRKADWKVYTFCEVDPQFREVNVVYPPEILRNTITEYLTSKGHTVGKFAETEKYAHVTFFFNGQREEPFEGEERFLIPSPKVATYDVKPEMSAPEIARKIKNEVKRNGFDLVVVNFANGDMVGHTGVLSAAICAVESVDRELRWLLEFLRKSGYDVVITADHGNAEQMLTDENTPHTAHTTNPVPIYLVGEFDIIKSTGKLGDVAVSILAHMGIEPPAEMDGEVIFR